ncbi:MAG: DUF1643 domain-containing protein [Caulobacterales bacterium]|nr:DUF1643 domain-containing protein [Caulobacterales bacterium]
MLNQSTADAEKLDPTITRCVGFAKREGYRGLRVINLFAYRATNPDELEIANDPIGAKNHEFLEEEVQRIAKQDGLIVCAWGARDFAKQEAKKFTKYALQKNTKLAALGVTLWGAPRHPLYVKASAPLIDISNIHSEFD